MNVSVIIATYEEEHWRDLALARAYPSALNQDAHEIVVGHDTHGGIAQVRNALAAKSTGDWLCFLDADDELAPGFLDAMKRAWERETKPRVEAVECIPPFLLTPAVQQVKKGRPGRPFFFPECSFTTGNWLVIGTLVQRDLFMEVGGFHEHPHGLEDWNLWARCVKAGARIVKVPKAVYIAHWNSHSKHHVFARNRPEYMKAYEAARVDV